MHHCIALLNRRITISYLQGFECPKNYNPADYFLGLLSNNDDDDTSLSLHSRGNSTAEASASNESIIAHLNNGEVEMVGGMLSGRPVADLSKLIDAFEDAKENDVLKKRIDVIQNSAVENPNDHKVKFQSKGPIKVTRAWCKEVNALYWVI